MFSLSVSACVREIFCSSSAFIFAILHDVRVCRILMVDVQRKCPLLVQVCKLSFLICFFILVFNARSVTVCAEVLSFCFYAHFQFAPNPPPIVMAKP